MIIHHFVHDVQIVRFVLCDSQRGNRIPAIENSSLPSESQSYNARCSEESRGASRSEGA